MILIREFNEKVINFYFLSILLFILNFKVVRIFIAHIIIVEIL